MDKSNFNIKAKWKVYVPNFYKEIVDSNKSIDEKNSELLKQNWFTNYLMKQIESNFPTQSEIVMIKEIMTYFQ